MKINNRGIVSSGVLALIGALVVVGVLGWYLLNESQKVNDEYEAADQANSSLLKQDDVAPIGGDDATNSEDQADTSSDEASGAGSDNEESSEESNSDEE